MTASCGARTVTKRIVSVSPSFVMQIAQGWARIIVGLVASCMFTVPIGISPIGSKRWPDSRKLGQPCGAHRHERLGVRDRFHRVVAVVAGQYPLHGLGRGQRRAVFDHADVAVHQARPRRTRQQRVGRQASTERERMKRHKCSKSCCRTLVASRLWQPSSVIVAEVPCNLSRQG